MGFAQPDTPSSPEHFAAVAVQPMNIQAPLDDLSAVTEAAVAVWGGIRNPSGPREQQAQAMMDSAQGFGAGGWDVDAGFHGEPHEMWPSNVEPGG